MSVLAVTGLLGELARYSELSVRVRAYVTFLYAFSL